MSEAKELPLYQCHKKVRALKIAAIETADKDVAGYRVIVVPEDNDYPAFRVSDSYVEKHKPQAGGYFVVYDDGYLSWSPAGAFEEGYTRLD